MFDSMCNVFGSILRFLETENNYGLNRVAIGATDKPHNGLDFKFQAGYDGNGIGPGPFWVLMVFDVKKHTRISNHTFTIS